MPTHARAVAPPAPPTPPEPPRLVSNAWLAGLLALEEVGWGGCWFPSAGRLEALRLLPARGGAGHWPGGIIPYIILLHARHRGDCRGLRCLNHPLHRLHIYHSMRASTIPCVPHNIHTYRGHVKITYGRNRGRRKEMNRMGPG